jgi:hypothetical protein
MNFDELSAQRRLVQDFCRHHVPSLLKFSQVEGPGFKLTPNELERRRVHLTTTATCIESLLACPERYRDSARNRAYDPKQAAQQFAIAAIRRKEWKSEESAYIYCRCRGLPLTINHLKKYDPQVEQHICRILNQLELRDGSRGSAASGKPQERYRFAVGEADLKDGAPPKAAEEARHAWYPPNAFHTFWTLEILRQFRKKFGNEYLKLASKLDLPRIEDGMLLWSRRTLGYQVALHAADSSILDSDQLAWSLATLLKFEIPFPRDLGEQDLLREALKQLFRTQLSIGTWRHYRSLFHYRKAGNAYCYIYETFAILLQIALDNHAERQLVRDILRPYVRNLTSLWQYAVSTRIALRTGADDEPSAIGWCSGHRLNQTEPESWATASVFAFAQAFRRLLGVWTRESARKGLNVVKPRFEDPVDEVIEKRGDTWVHDEQPGVTERLCTMFINPIRMHGGGDALEPDTEPIQAHQARSAILFGPPGTSKTTLCRAVAESIGWDYIELHASHFVADGLQNVQKKADDIFRRLTEIDRAVVLFDEIDELVRERVDEHDAFGRFLTTSMLPKLAELWNQRKIVYFVATNHIRYFDTAITRSQRFDALILVSPPSYLSKISRLKKLGCNGRFGNLEKRMWEALLEAGKSQETGSSEAGEGSEAEMLRNSEALDAVCALKRILRNRPEGEVLRETEALARFVLLRWDELDELASHLKKFSQNMPDVDVDIMRSALKAMTARARRTPAQYSEFIKDLDYRGRDFDKELVWVARGFDRPYESDCVTVTKQEGADLWWLSVRYLDDAPEEVDGFLRVKDSKSPREPLRYAKKV